MESDDVYVAGISVKVFAHYPGRSEYALIARIQKSAEVILHLMAMKWKDQT